jgi:flagellar basal-body rod protein FlgG
MIRSLMVAATGMSAQQHNIDNISNNIANLNTTSFKRGLTAFKDLIYQDDTISGAKTSDAGNTLPSGVQFGLGAALGSLYKSFTQGDLISTPGVPTNVAFDGSGFLQVTMPDGTIAYTRDGNLQLDSTGQFVTSEGYVIAPGITLPDAYTNLTITPNGKVQVEVNNILQEVGQFELARFPNPSGLSAIGGNLYRETTGSGAAVTGIAGDTGFGLMKQFFTEASNVNSILEIGELIKAQRAFEFNSKVIQTSEHVLKTMIDTKA